MATATWGLHETLWAIYREEERALTIEQYKTYYQTPHGAYPSPLECFEQALSTPPTPEDIAYIKKELRRIRYLRVRACMRYYKANNPYFTTRGGWFPEQLKYVDSLLKKHLIEPERSQDFKLDSFPYGRQRDRRSSEGSTESFKCRGAGGQHKEHLGGPQKASCAHGRLTSGWLSIIRPHRFHG